MRHELRHKLLLLFLADRPDLRQLLRHVQPQRVQHRFEQLERFRFVFVQRIALGIAAKAHDRPQMFKAQQVLAPLGVDGLQQKLFFDSLHCLGAKGIKLFAHHLVRCCDDPVPHGVLINALFSGPVSDRQVHAHPLAAGNGQPLSVPLVDIGLGRKIFIHQIFDHLMPHVLDDFRQIFRLHDLQPLAENGLALIVHHIVELQQLLADVEVAAFNLGLRLFQRFVDPGVNNGLAFLHTQRRQHLVQAFAAENAHQVIFQRQKEAGPARVTLAARPATQLVVDPAAFVTFRCQNEQAARLDHLLLLVGMLAFNPGAHLVRVQMRVGGKRFEHLHLHIAAQLDVGSATGHVGGDGHRAELAGIRHNLRFLFMLAGVQHVVRNALFGQQGRQRFGFLDAGRTHKNRLALGIGLADRLDHTFVFLAGGAVDLIMLVHTGDGPVGRHFHHAQLVNLHEFLGFGRCRAGHACQLFVQAEVILECHAGQGGVFRLNLHAFLRLDCLMQPVRQTAALHHAPGEFVDQHHLAVADDVLLVLVEQRMRPQRLRHMMHQRRAFGIVKRIICRQQPCIAQQLLDHLVAVIGVGHVAGLFIDLVMLWRQFGDQLVHRDVQIRPVLRWAGYDQRRARLVHQDAVHLVDDGKVMPALRHLFDGALHVVAQVIEPQLVVGRIGDVGLVGLALFRVRLIGIDDACRQPQRAIDLAHPFRIALGQIVVHRDHMHALAGQGIQIGRKCRDQGLAFARLHFSDIALMQENAALQLHIEGAQAQCAFCRLAAIRKGFGQQRIQAFALGHPFLEFCGLRDDVLIAQCGELRLQCIDLRHKRTNRLDLAVIRRAEDLPRERSETQHIFSAWSFLTRSCEARALPASTAFHRRAKKAQGALSHATCAM